MRVDADRKVVVFRRKSDAYELPYDPIDDDKLHPCVLFYYINDEVEFLPDYKE